VSRKYLNPEHWPFGLQVTAVTTLILGVGPWAMFVVYRYLVWCLDRMVELWTMIP
jgi:hypothetical protein